MAKNKKNASNTKAVTSEQILLATARRQAWFWGSVAVLFFLGLYVLQPILLPFVLGGVIAYALDPFTEKLVARKVPRSLATLVVLVIFFVLFIGFFFVITPVIQAQIARLSQTLPQYIEQIRLLVQEGLARLPVEEKFVQDFKNLAESQGGRAVSAIGNIASYLFSGGLALVNFISFLFITPIISFFLLRDWPSVVEEIDKLLPRSHAKTIRTLAQRMNEKLAAFFRGQVLVCLSLGVFYAAGLSLAGLEFGLLIGLFTGIISFIPYLGAILGGVLSIGLAVIQFQDVEKVGIIALIFVIGQVLEGNVLAPKLVGDRLGLHPVWVIFALFAGAALFGFVGVLIAMPVMAVLSVLAAYTIEQYKKSSFYK